MKSSPTINDLAAALAKAQGEFTAAERDHIAKVMSKKGEGSSYSYAYADLQAYLEVCRKPLADNGLAFIQDVGVDGQKATVVTILTHASGQWIESNPLTLTASDSMPQSIGSAVTYARRYSLSAVLGMASEADDDANGAQGNQAATAPRENNLPACPQCQTNKSVIAGKAEYGGGFVCFAKKGGCGQKWQADGEVLLYGAKREPQNTANQDSSTERPAVKHAQAVAAEHGLMTAEQLERRKRDDKWVADVTESINKAADYPALLAISDLIQEKNGYVKGQLRAAYSARAKELKEPAMAGVG